MRLPHPVVAALTTLLAVPAAVGLAAPVAAATPTDVFFSEYVEGSGFNKAIEIFNGTGAAIDLGAAGYTLELYSNGAAAPSQAGRARGHRGRRRRVRGVAGRRRRRAASPRPTRLAPAVANWNGDDAVVLRKGGALIDVIGQIGFDPGAEWGTGAASTADNTIRRGSDVDAGDTNGATPSIPPPSGTASPSTPSTASASTRSTGGGGNQPVTVTCGGPLSTVAGTAVSRVVTATDADGTVVDVAIAGVSPAPSAGTIGGRPSPRGRARRHAGSNDHG